MTEKALQEAIREAALYLGWLYYHTFDSRRSPAGFPDVVLCKPPRFLVRELKTERGRVSPAQTEWLERLELAGLDVGIWRPSDWLEGRVLSELQ